MKILSFLYYFLGFPLKALAVLFVCQMPGLALPQGGQVTQGSATIQQVNDTKLNINQSSDRAVINWNSFSIAPQEWVNFQQPSSTSATLNRVTGSTPSSIAGRLTANGQVFLVNPNGIAFLPSARVDVAGLVASTLNIKDTDFMQGILRFEQVPGKPPASVVNEGLITVQEAGFAALVAPAVRNSGVISARLGKVVLASGSTVSLDFYGDGLLSVTVDPKLAGEITDIYGNKLTSLIDNQGNILAPGGVVTLTAQAAGQIVDSVINVGGIIEAKYAENRNGVIVLSGGSKGTVAVNGTLDVSGEKGGKVEITGEKIALNGNALIDASGDKGGGVVNIGGSFQGKGTLQNALETTVAKDVQIKADALTSGDGGKIIVWADGITKFDGFLSAKGGEISGNGGFAEISGKETLNLGANWANQIQLSAPNGKFGTLLLDPNDITIVTGSVAAIGSSPTNSNTLGASDIQAFLGTASLIIETTGTGGNGDITINSGVNITWSEATTLTLNADRKIVMNTGAIIENTSTTTGFDAIIFNANKDGTTTGAFAGISLNNSKLTTNGGNIILTGTGGNAGSFNYGIFQQLGAQVTTTNGSITYTGKGGNGTNSNNGIFLANPNTRISTTGTGTINLTGTGGGNGTGINNYGIFQFEEAQVTSTNGDITYTGTGGNGTKSNHGIFLNYIDTKITTSTGAINLTGTGGGNGTGNSNIGIFHFNDAQVTSTNGNITYIGTGGNGINENHGIKLNNTNTKISTDTGAINLTGTGGGNGTGNDNYGIFQQSGAQVTSTDGSITYTGTGGNGTKNNHGIFLKNGNTRISTDTGAIALTGTGKGTGRDNYGIYQQLATQVTSTDGSITYTGTGGNGTDRNHGIFLEDTGTRITTITGAITLIGTGNGTDSNNIGIFQFEEAQVTSTNGNITYTGTGGNGAGFSYGILLESSNTKISTDTGAISLTGNGNGTGINNYGIFQVNGAQVASTNGNITYTGTGGNGTDRNYGIWLNGTNTKISTTGTGAISLTGTGQGTGSDNIGIVQQASAQVSTTSGNITYTGTGANGADAIFTQTGANLIGNNTAGVISITSTNNPITLNDVTVKTTSNILITSPESVTQNNNGGLFANGLELKGAGSFTLTNPNNDINILAGNTTNNIQFTDTNGFDIGTVNLTNGVNVTASKNLTLTAGDTVTQSQSIIANGLELLGAGAFTLTNANNDINILAGNTTNNINYVDKNSLTVATVNSTTGINTSGNITVESGDTLTVEADIDGIVSSAGITTLTATNDIIFGTVSNFGDTRGQKLVLNAGRDIIIDNATFVQSDGSGGIDLFAGRDFTIANAIGAGSLLNSNGGGAPINIKVGGTFTLDSGAPSGIAANGGNITITADQMALTSGNIGSSGLLLIQPLNAATTIGLGTGATGTLNLDTAEIGRLLDGFSLITIGRPDGTGKIDIRTAQFKDNVIIRSPAGTGTININGALSTGTGTETGTIALLAGESIIGNTGSITTQGQAITLNSDRDAKNGGAIQLTGTTITSNGGDIILGGGADPSLDPAIGVVGFNSGILLDGTQLNAGAGDISLIGQGRNTVAANSHGISIINNSSLTTTTGAIELIGDGGNRLLGIIDNNSGINIADSKIQSDSGEISLEGNGGSSPIGANNAGVILTNSSIINADGDILITGEAGNALLGTLNNNTGIVVSGSNIENQRGNIELSGFGGNSLFGASNIGISIIKNSVINNTDGAISLFGVGGNSLTNLITNNDGVNISQSEITNSIGTIEIIGVGGNSLLGKNNVGLRLIDSNLSNDKGVINLAGAGGLSLKGNTGILQDGTTVKTTSGNIFYDAEGTGSAIGLIVNDTSTIGEGTSGDIELTSEAMELGGVISGQRVLLQQPSSADPLSDFVVQTGGSIQANQLSLDGFSFILDQAKNNTVFLIGSADIRIQYTDNDGFEILGLETPTAILTAGGLITQSAPITVTNLAILGTGNTQLTNPNNAIKQIAADTTGNLKVITKGTLTVDTVNPDGIENSQSTFLQSLDGDIVLNKSVNATGDITLVADGNFINNVGTGALNTKGIFLVYATSPAGNVNGWPVLGGSQQFNTTFPQPALFAGSGFLYKVGDVIPPFVPGLPSGSTFTTAPITFVVNFNDRLWRDLSDLGEAVLFPVQDLLCVNVAVNQSSASSPATQPIIVRNENLPNIRTQWQAGELPKCLSPDSNQ